MVHLKRRNAFGLLVVACLAVVPPAFAAESTCGITGVARIVAVGDVHASYDNLVSVLTMAGLVDRSAHWAGGHDVLVQVGDILDRGVQTRAVLDLLMRLETEARAAGGRVIVLLGNHDVMNILGDLSAVQAAEYAGWTEPGTAAPPAPSGQPPGFVERAQALSASGKYGQWLRGHEVVATVNGVAFLHGGLSPEVAALGCQAINRKVRTELGAELDRTKANPHDALATAERGPLNYRGLAQEDETAFLPSVEKVLRSMEVKAVVVGHTPTGDGKIRPRFGGRVVMIDVGILPSLGGHLAALEVKPGGSLTAMYPTGREALERKAAETVKSPGHLLIAAHQ